MRHSASSTSSLRSRPASASLPRPASRLLFDEQLSPRAALALRALRVPASHASWDADELLPRGVDDADLIDHCLRTDRVVVSSSCAMVIMCAEEGQRVVWLDPWSREFTRDEQVLVLFSHMKEIERLLAEGAESVRVLRTRVEALAFEDVARLASQRLAGLTITRSKKAGSPRDAR